MRPAFSLHLNLNFKKDDGYTLLELMVVLGILAMSYALITPMVGGRANSAQLNSSAQKIVSDLRTLRTEAMLQGKILDFDIIEEGKGYKVSNKEKPDHLSEGTLLKSDYSSNEENRIRFYPDGTNSGFNLLLTDKDNMRRISSEWLMGRIQVQNEN